MNKRKTSYEYKQEKIAKLETELKDLNLLLNRESAARKELEKQLKEYEHKIVELDGENNRLYQHDCQLVNELKEAYETIDKLEGNHKETKEELQKYKTEPESEESFNQRKESAKDITNLYIDRILNNLAEYCLKELKWINEPEPVYIPFTFADADKLIFQVIKNKATNEPLVITRVRKDTIESGKVEIVYRHLFNYYTFLDGSPCGKIAEWYHIVNTNKKVK